MHNAHKSSVCRLPGWIRGEAAYRLAARRLLQEDIFFLTCQDLGELSEVEIEHDNSGPSPGWHCEQVWRSPGPLAQLSRILC